ncbi:MAG: hypothetical protein U0930_13845 [Pirellulales bacterium]
MKKRSLLQPVFVAGMCCTAFAWGWMGYRRNHPAMNQVSTTTDALTTNHVSNCQEIQNWTRPPSPKTARSQSQLLFSFNQRQR